MSRDAPPAGDADPFAALLTLVTPDRLLRDPRATGESVRVCVIDTGMDRELLVERARRRGHDPNPIEGAFFSSSCRSRVIVATSWAATRSSRSGTWEVTISRSRSASG